MNSSPADITDVQRSKYRKRWLVFAPFGLLLIGFGLCVFGSALFKMRDNASMTEWFLWGTGSLVLINSGLCFFGQAVKYSILYELTGRKDR